MSQRQQPSTLPSRLPIAQRTPAETQDLVRDYVREARRKIEARAGISNSDGAWPPTLLTTSSFPKPPSGFFSASPSSSGKSPLLTNDNSPRYDSPITPETPANPTFTSSLHPPLPTAISFDRTAQPRSPYILQEDISGSSSDSDLPRLSRDQEQFSSLSPARKTPNSGLLIFPYTPGPASRSSPSLDSTLENASSPSPHARKSPALGPPPSARRGPPSAYSQISLVTPIMEESDNSRALAPSKSPRGLMSSKVSQDSRKAGGLSPIVDEETSDQDLRKLSKSASDGDLIVKQIEVSRKRPSLTTIKSGDKLLVAERSEPFVLVPPKTPHMTRTSSLKSLPHSVSSVKSRGSEPGPTPGFFGSDSVLLESRPSQESFASLRKNSDASGRHLDSPAPKISTPKSPLVPIEFQSSAPNSRTNSMGRTRSIASRYSVTPRPLGSAENDSKPASINEESPVALARPAPMLAPAEVRISATPLPELIKRAMRLASNLEVSYRSSSRASGQLGSEVQSDTLRYGSPGRGSGFGFNAMSKTVRIEESARPLGADGSSSPKDQIRYSQWRYSDPQSGEHTPGYSQGYSPLRKEMRDQSPERKGRRCCGMPLWVFILVIIILLILIAAAVIVPVALIVLPKLHSASSGSTSPSTSTSPVTACQAQLTCANGGTNIVTADGTCRCVCVNGFTGATCTENGGTSCVTTQVGSVQKATLGSAIPRLFASAQSTFQVSLAPATLLSVFATTGLNCNTENALVTFNGLASPAATTARRNRRNAQPQQQQQYADDTSLDFGRICVLYILQQLADLSAAEVAQNALQTFFGNTGAEDAYNVNIGNNYTVDMVDRVLYLAGKIVGGPGG